MKRWDIYLFPFSQEQPHPAVILSHDDQCQRCDQVNALEQVPEVEPPRFDKP
jgi:hypothetical protein